MLMTTDTALVQLAVFGDRDAFAAIYQESFRCVYAFAVRRTANREAAETLAEAIMVRVFEALGSYGGNVPFAAWLHSIAKSVALPSESRRRPMRVAPTSPSAHSYPR